MPKFMAAFILNSIYKQWYYTHTHTPFRAIWKGHPVCLFSWVLKSKWKFSFSKLRQWKKDFKLKEYCPKRLVSGLCWNTMWDMRLERSKKELGVKWKRKNKINVFYSHAINYLFGASSYFLMFMLFTFWVSTCSKLPSKLPSSLLYIFSHLLREYLTANIKSTCMCYQ